MDVGNTPMQEGSPACPPKSLEKSGKFVKVFWMEPFLTSVVIKSVYLEEALCSPLSFVRIACLFK